MKQMMKRAFAALVLAAMCAALLCPAVLADEPAVSAVMPTGVSLNKSTISLAEGDSYAMTATVQPAGANQAVNWICTNTSVASVDADGLVTALAEGKTAVRATAADGSVSASCTIYVYSATPIVSLRVGESRQLPAAGSFRSANASIAAVDDSGTVTGVGFGKTTVSVTAGSSTTTYAVSVGAYVGIDVSSWNYDFTSGSGKAIDWASVKNQGVDFAMIRCGYGWEHTDASFVKNINGAIANAVPVGVYFYSYAKTVDQAKTEARYCINLLSDYKGSMALPVAYDLEEYGDLGSGALTKIALAFCQTMQEAGYNTMVYANSSFFRQMDLDQLQNNGIDFWYAWWPTVPAMDVTHTINSTSIVPMIWQYTDYGTISGATSSSGKTDVNLLYMPEYATIPAPSLQVTASGTTATLTWGGSAFASGYTVTRVNAAGDSITVGTYSGATHKCSDTTFAAGDSYYVTMTVSDPIGGAYTRHVASATVQPAATPSYIVTLKADTGGTVSGGGTVVSGQSATATATPAEKYTFEGWYSAAGTRVSTAASYTFTVSESVTLTAKFTADPETPVVPPTSSGVDGFTDVAESDWYAEAVSFAVENGLFTGTTDTTFSPGGTMTRAMLVTVLYRQAGAPDVSNHNRFNDVSADAWYAKAVTWAYDNGVVTGTADKLFSPNAAVTREQMATILYRYSTAKELTLDATVSDDLTAFSDGDTVSAYAQESMRWAVSTQLITGADNKLSPKASATRAQCATILMRWLTAVEQ